MGQSSSIPMRAMATFARCFAALCTLLALQAPPSACAADDVTQIAVDSANPPLMYGSSTSAKGLYPALLDALFGHMGEAVALSAVPWQRAMVLLDEGRAGAGGIYKTAEREKKYDFSEPLFVERVGVYFNVRKPVQFRTLADLSGLRVGVVAGWSYGDEFDRARKAGKFIVEAVPSDIQNIGKVELGRVDIALLVTESATALLAQGQFPSVQRAAALLIETPTYLAFSKRAAKGALLVRLNAALVDMRANGSYNRIVNRELGISK
jgi:polar amino acid transport system substrate-binding protein